MKSTLWIAFRSGPGGFVGHRCVTGVRLPVLRSSVEIWTGSSPSPPLSVKATVSPSGLKAKVEPNTNTPVAGLYPTLLSPLGSLSRRQPVPSEDTEKIPFCSWVSAETVRDFWDSSHVAGGAQSEAFVQSLAVPVQVRRFW